MSVDRRDFLKIGVTAAAGSMGAAGLPMVASALAGKGETSASADNQWGMVIDIDKCAPGCDACITACHTENNVPAPHDPAHDIHWIRQVTFKQRGVENAEERSLPVMCFHCEHAPCEHVCPVEATFTRKDGVVLVDKHRCIGCRYCMIACPYKARSFVSSKVDHEKGQNPDVPIRMKGVVEKCTLCVHRIDRGEEPACVVACREKGGGGMSFGNINDPDSDVAKAIKSSRATRLRADLGTNPRVFYLGI